MIKFIAAIVGAFVMHMNSVEGGIKDKISLMLTEYARVIAAMPQTYELFRDVRMIYNDPMVTSLGTYGRVSRNEGSLPGHELDKEWYPSFRKKTKGSDVIVHGKPIYYKIYVPENKPIKAVIFDIYGGKALRDEYFFGWYYAERVLASRGIAIVQISLSDIYGKDDNGKEFPNQLHFEEQHFRILMEEIATFIEEGFSSIIAEGQEKVLEQMKTAPKFLMGDSFGGLMTLKCATDPDFLEDVHLDGFIASAPVTYEYQTNDSEIERFKDLETKKIRIDFSPLIDVHFIEKPILLMHGQNDMRVPLDHSLRFYEESKKLRKPVSLWVNSSDVRHGGIEPGDGTLSAAKENAARKVAVIEDFIHTRIRPGSDEHFNRWYYAYPKTNNSDGIAGGVNYIADNPKQAYFRMALKSLPEKPTKEMIDAYVKSHFVSELMILEIQKKLKKTLFSRTPSAHEFTAYLKKFWEFNDSSSFFFNYPKLTLDNLYSKNLRFYLDNSMGSDDQFIQFVNMPTVKEDIAKALLQTYTTYYYGVFGFESKDAFIKALQDAVLNEMMEEYAKPLYKIYQISE